MPVVSPAMNENPFDRRPPRRILLVCTQRIGDVLLATPLARSMKRAWPEAEIHFLAFRGTEGVLAGNPDITRVIAFPQRTDWRGKLAQFRQLWRKYDLAVTPMPTDRARLYAWVAAPIRVGFVTAEAKEKSKTLLLSRWLTFDDQDTHTVAMGERLTELLGIPARYQVVPPALAPDALAASLARLAPLGGLPYVVLHPYPKFPYKMWRQAAWAELASWLMAQGLGVVLTGGPDKDEVAYCGQVAARITAMTLAGSTEYAGRGDFPSPPAPLPEGEGSGVSRFATSSGLVPLLDLSGQMNLAETAEIVGRARLYVGPDTAVTHIAAATGVASIALFGPSNPVKWGPWPKGWQGPASPWPRQGSARHGNVHLIQGPGDCVPCLLEGCDRHQASLSQCLQDIPVDTVIKAAQEMLASK